MLCAMFHESRVKNLLKPKKESFYAQTAICSPRDAVIHLSLSFAHFLFRPHVQPLALLSSLQFLRVLQNKSFYFVTR